MRRAVLTDIELPDFGDPGAEPGLGRAVYEARLERLNRRMAEAGERAGRALRSTSAIGTASSDNMPLAVMWLVSLNSSAAGG